MNSTCVRASHLAAAVSLALVGNGLLAATITVDSDDDDPASTACNLRDALKAINDGSTLAPTSHRACSRRRRASRRRMRFAQLWKLE